MKIFKKIMFSGEYGGTVGARGMMFSNTEMPTNLGMRKLTKPEHYTVTKRVRETNYQIQNFFHAQPSQELVTSTVPLLARIRPSGFPVHKLVSFLPILNGVFLYLTLRP